MSQKKFLNVRAVCARYSNIADRTVDRWVASGTLPQPIYICGQRYWEETVLDEHDKARRAPAALSDGTERRQTPSRDGDVEIKENSESAAA